ncbi:MAG TPA: type II secretion system protein [Candidatus Limnocylindria bacterium]|nr:type II secretion system protein [Candidatus Limnocylindria bacterium]
MIEILVVLAVVALICGLLLPALTRARHAADGVSCVSHLKVIGLAVRTFEVDFTNCPWASTNGIIRNGKPFATRDLDTIYRVFSNDLHQGSLVCPADRRPQYSRKQPVATAPANYLAMNPTYFFNVAILKTDEALDSVLAGDRNLILEGSPGFDYRQTTLTTPEWNLGLGPSGAIPLTGLKFSTAVHNSRGNILLGDGSVQQVSSARLVEAMEQSRGSY